MVGAGADGMLSELVVGRLRSSVEPIVGAGALVVVGVGSSAR